MKTLTRSIFTLILASTVTLTQAAGLDSISTGDASSGVKEALAKGADYAVSSLGKQNGFLGNSKVKIPLPDGLKKAEKAMRTFGMGKQADELVDTMNHAAENAVAEAKPILMDSIKKMSVNDAKGILTGGDDSVTNYFKRTSTEALTQKFMPIVQGATKKVQLGEQYNKFAEAGAKFGLVKKEQVNLEQYVTQKALDGVYLMMAKEEAAIRKDPVGQGSALLKKVFGALGN